VRRRKTIVDRGCKWGERREDKRCARVVAKGVREDGSSSIYSGREGVSVPSQPKG